MSRHQSFNQRHRAHRCLLDRGLVVAAPVVISGCPACVLFSQQLLEARVWRAFKNVLKMFAVPKPNDLVRVTTTTTLIAVTHWQ